MFHPVWILLSSQTPETYFTFFFFLNKIKLLTRIRIKERITAWESERDIFMISQFNDFKKLFILILSQESNIPKQLKSPQF